MSAQPCKVSTCDRPKRKGKHFCEWHWLARQSSDVQADAATARLLERPVSAHRARVPRGEWPDGERWCAGCQSFVPQFYCSGSRCRACANMAAHARRLETTYGIDAAEYERIFAAQGRRCGICRNRPASIRFAVDHDHKSGEVRGILCKRCNHDLLGGGHDSIEMLFAAIRYLLFPPAQPVGYKVTVDHVLSTLRERLLAAEEARRASARVEPQPPPF